MHSRSGSCMEDSYALMLPRVHECMMVSWTVHQTQALFCLTPLRTCGCVFLLPQPQDKKRKKKKKKKKTTYLQAICWNRSLWWRHAVNAPRPQINTWIAIFSKKVARRSFQGCTRNERHQRISSVLDWGLLILDADGSKMSSLWRVEISLMVAENVTFCSVSVSEHYPSRRYFETM